MSRNISATLKTLLNNLSVSKKKKVLKRIYEHVGGPDLLRKWIRNELRRLEHEDRT